MNKVALKTKIKAKQNGRCYLSAKKLAEETKFYDTDRLEPKTNGGTYTEENTRLADPVEHMKRHNNYRVRDKEMTELKSIMDGREQVRKLVNSFNNRILAMKRGTDELDKITVEWLNLKMKETQSQLSKIDRRVAKYLKGMNNLIIKSALQIRGLGSITIAYMLIYVDITKAQYASSLWKYVGLHTASHERYTKGESGGGNKTLRTVLYAMAESMIKTRSVYRDVYDAEKTKLSASEKLVMSRNTQGKLIECMWKDTKPCHRHGAAIRKMIKHFLADFWFVWRTVEGLPVAQLYVEAKLGHTGIVKPVERGWEY